MVVPTAKEHLTVSIKNYISPDSLLFWLCRVREQRAEPTCPNTFGYVPQDRYLLPPLAMFMFNKRSASRQLWMCSTMYSSLGVCMLGFSRGVVVCTKPTLGRGLRALVCCRLHDVLTNISLNFLFTIQDYIQNTLHATKINVNHNSQSQDFPRTMAVHTCISMIQDNLSSCL
jgi:hypothetical protein